MGGGGERQFTKLSLLNYVTISGCIFSSACVAFGRRLQGNSLRTPASLRFFYKTRRRALQCVQSISFAKDTLRENTSTEKSSVIDKAVCWEKGQ